MSTVSNLTIGGGYGELFRRAFNVWYHKDKVVVGKKLFRYTRGYKQKIKGNSFMEAASGYWDSMQGWEKELWGVCASYTNMNGYNLFMQDTMWRYAHNIPGITTPVISHQYKYAHCYIPENSGNVLFRQTGNAKPKNNIYMGLSYMSVLTADGAPPNTLIMRFRCFKLVNGIRTAYELSQELDINTAWSDLYLAEEIGDDCLEGWNFELEANHVKGNFWFDNIFMTDEDKVYSKDTACDNVRRFWHGLNLPDGVDLNSIYEE